MKHFKRSGLYKASNVSFDPVKIEALSYDWWVFVSRIGKLTVFNDYRYSLSTSKHQSKVRALLSDLGIKIDRTVSFRSSLRGVSTLRELNKLQRDQDHDNAVEAEEKRIERNAKARRRRIEALKLEKIEIEQRLGQVADCTELYRRLDRVNKSLERGLTLA